MNPLIQKYFAGELNHPEEEQLETLLRDSEEAAWEFGQVAEETYGRYGLPEPGTGGPAAPSEGESHWPWIIPLLGLLLVGSVWWWLAKSRRGPEALAPVKPTPQRVEKERPAPVKKAVPIKPLATPPEGAKDKVSGTDLRVVVKRQSAGPVTVAVVNSYGLEVRSLYTGVLQPGRWAFEWDGKVGSGALADPGKYRIEVRTEAGTQSKDLTIR